MNAVIFKFIIVFQPNSFPYFKPYIINLSNVLCITKATIGYFPPVYIHSLLSWSVIHELAKATCLLKT